MYKRQGLDKASSKITTFLLPQGKFRYLRAPMGLNASSDEWCCKSDVLIRGISWAKKIVDDMLIWAENMEELMERTRIILGRCREYSITISRKKLELGSKINSQDTLFHPTAYNQTKKNMQQLVDSHGQCPPKI